MEVKRKEKVAGWLQGVTVLDESYNFSDIMEDAIRAASPLCSALSQALDGGSNGGGDIKQYNLACQMLTSGGGLEAHLSSPEQTGAVVRYLLALAGGRLLDPARHAELARLLLACRPPCRLMDAPSVERYARMCLALASRRPDLCQLAISSAVGWFYPSAGGGDEQPDSDRRQFALAHRLLEALAAAFPATAPAAICEQAESRCLWGRPGRQLACYLLNMLRAASTYLAGHRIRLLAAACRIVAKLEGQLTDEEAGAGADGSAGPSCSCAANPPSNATSEEPPSSAEEEAAAAADMAARVSSRRRLPGDWELSPELHRLLARQLCRGCELRRKLNVALHLLACHVSDELADAADWRRVRAVYKDLLTVFDRELAHQAGPSRLLLLLALPCAASDRIAHGFLDYLWKRAIDSRAGRGLRLRCLALLGDLCARCAFAHAHLLQTVLLLLADYARRLAARYDKQAGTLGSDEAAMFHACVGAFVRIAVRRHRDLLGPGAVDASFLAGTHFHLVLRSSLRPWPALPADLRTGFARLCRRYRLAAFSAALAAADADVLDDNDGVVVDVGASARKRRRKSRVSAAPAEPAVTPPLPPPLPARLDDLSLVEHLLAPLLLPPDELKEEEEQEEPEVEETAAEEQQTALASPEEQQKKLEKSCRAAEAPSASSTVPEQPQQQQLVLAEALLEPQRRQQRLFARRRKRLRSSECVVFGDSPA